MGDFAIWAITDLSTGEIQYVVDDSWGSEIAKLNHGITEIMSVIVNTFSPNNIVLSLSLFKLI